MKNIELTQGKFAIVDDKDFKYLSQWKWHLNNSGYAMRSVHHSGIKLGNKYKHHNILMHRFLLDVPKNKVIDHINRNRLDNRKENLRIVDRIDNQHNMKIFNTNTSGYKGIDWLKSRKRWRTRIVVKYKEIYLGYFLKIEDAIKARKLAEVKYHAI